MENYKTDERNQRQHKQMQRYYTSWVERINIVKMTILTNAVYRFNAILIKLPMIFFFTELEKDFVQFVWKHKRPQITKAVSKKKNSWRNQTPCLQTILYSYSNQSIMLQHKNRNIDQWNKIESPEINTAPTGSLFLTKEARIYNEAKTAKHKTRNYKTLRGEQAKHSPT